MTLISRIETYYIAPRWLFVRIETDSAGDRRLGRGQLRGPRAEQVRTAVDQLSELLIGTDPLQIEDTWQVLTKGGFYRGGRVVASAVSGIDQAPVGHRRQDAIDAPVHQLLGGPVRDRVRIYGWVGGDEPGEVATRSAPRSRPGSPPSR